jgi:hypothetical protein
MGADVEVPAFGAGMDRGVGKRHDLAGQHQILICRVALRMHDVDNRHRLLSVGCCQSGFGRGAMVDALIDPAAKQHGHDNHDQHRRCAFPARRRSCAVRYSPDDF